MEFLCCDVLLIMKLFFILKINIFSIFYKIGGTCMQAQVLADTNDVSQLKSENALPLDKLASLEFRNKCSSAQFRYSPVKSF